MVKAGVLTLGSILRLMWGNHRNGEGAVTWLLKDWLLGGMRLETRRWGAVAKCRTCSEGRENGVCWTAECDGEGASCWVWNTAILAAQWPSAVQKVDTE